MRRKLSSYHLKRSIWRMSYWYTAIAGDGRVRCLLETGRAMTLEMSSINATFLAPSNYARPLPTSASMASFPTAGFLAIRPFSPIKKAAGVARMSYAFDTLHFLS